MTYKDSIKWLEALKREIGQVQHRDLWHFEEAIDEIIIKLEPLAKPHGRLIDRDKLPLGEIDRSNRGSNWVEIAPIVVEAEAGE